MSDPDNDQTMTDARRREYEQACAKLDTSAQHFGRTNFGGYTTVDVQRVGYAVEVVASLNRTAPQTEVVRLGTGSSYALRALIARLTLAADDLEKLEQARADLDKRFDV